MTRILLFSPSLPERTYPGRPPIYYLSAALRRAGHSVFAIDVDIVGRKEFVRLLRAFDPEIVAGTSLSIQINDAMALFSIAKRHSPDALTILGGNHATAAGDYLYPLHRNILDAVVAGEGLFAIKAIAELVHRRLWMSGRGDVPGLLFCDGRTIVTGPLSTAEAPDDYDPDLPYHPSYDFEIFGRNNRRLLRTFQLMTAFGCSNACFFCFSSVNKRGETQRVERRMSMAAVDRVLRRGRELGYEAVYFDDDTFTRDRQHALEVARLCKRHGLVFGCHTRPDCEDEDLIEQMVHDGCRYMFSGFETAVPEILTGANKTSDPVAYRDSYRRSYRTKKRLGLAVSAFLIHGMPRRSNLAAADPERSAGAYKWAPDTLEDSAFSIDVAVRELDPSYLSMNILRFIPGVPFSESPTFAFLRPVEGKLHGGYFDEAWLHANGAKDPRSWHPILRAFEGAGSPIPQHMTPLRCYDILRVAVDTVNRKNDEPGRNQTRLVVDPWFRTRFLIERWSGGVLSYDLAPFEAIDTIGPRDSKIARDEKSMSISVAAPA